MLPRHLLGLALALSACSLLGGTGDGETETSASSETGGVPTTGASEVCFLDPNDCAPPALCERVDCVDQHCVHAPRAVDEQDDDVPGDCQRHICDGAGGATPIADPFDVPDDGNACTQDQCTAQGPANVPQEPGSVCGDAGYCHADLSCQACPERDGCIDDSPAEPNETQSAAHPRAQISDAEGPDHACEALAGPGDVDWFTLAAIDLVVGKVDPAITISPAELQVCIYFQCKTGGTSVQCPVDTVAGTSPLGQLGCCGHGSLTPQIDCKGALEDATLWLMVGHDPDAPAGPDCLNYQLDYEF